MLCGHESRDDGFLEDMGVSSYGYARWVAGPLERGFFGGAKRMRRTRRAITAVRCQQCGHLELFAHEES